MYPCACRMPMSHAACPCLMPCPCLGIRKCSIHVHAACPEKHFPCLSQSFGLLGKVIGIRT